MNLEELEKKIQALVTKTDEDTFIYDLLLTYKQPKASITRLRKGDYNIAKNSGEILWKKKLYFKAEYENDLHGLIDQLQTDLSIRKHHPRFIIVTDFKTFLSVDTKTEDTLDIAFGDLWKHYDFFLPWAGMEKTQLQSENPADIKAAERMGRLYDIILEDNPTKTDADRHALNIFLSRLLFCFFAEDTGIFEDDQFTNAVGSHTAVDGSDLQVYLQKLFNVLNLEERLDFPKYLQAFPYVNGGLFADEYLVPNFTARSRKIILECGALNWKQINPDIFGSMMQAVVHTSQRGNLGMHYTSVVNIMKVIEPLFLNDLRSALDKAGDSKTKLKRLLTRLQNLRIFDPACGSGNFLIITYKELCRLEIEIFKKLYGRQQHVGQVRALSNIKLTQFYGIELDDFAHETAKLSLWLAEHQMNLAFRAVFNDTKPTLPLQDGGNIVCGNATRVDWSAVCPKTAGAEIYILGNPPYLGTKYQLEEHKSDMAEVFEGIKNYKTLDYVSCWFMIGARYIQNCHDSHCAFVSTNSICQGVQAGIIWPNIFEMQLEIGFAYRSFKWTNSAKGNAGVICVIVGIRNFSTQTKYLFDSGVCSVVKNINPYLTSGGNLTVSKRSKPLSNLPAILYGNKPADGGHLILSAQEKHGLLETYPVAEKFVKKYVGSQEFIKGLERWCLWIEDSSLEEARRIPEIANRLDKVHEFRLGSKKKATQKKASVPHQFVENRHSEKTSIIIPVVSSERRKYIPTGFVDSGTVINVKAFAVYDADPYILAIVASSMHMTWVRAVGGRMKTDYSYINTICYNAFPFPDITDAEKTILESLVFNVLDEREKHSEKTMAQLYDPDKMPDGLRRAHHEMDLAVEKCYRSRPFKNDDERLEYLFKLYEEMIEAEKR